MNKRIEGGATIWARKTIESDIFYWKPDIWFKIWFYIVNKVNHKDTKLFKRGTNFFNYSREKNYINGSTIDQWKKCVGWLKSSNMVSTTKSTRGVIIEVLNYAFYQELDNYRAPQEAPSTALQKHYGSTTINKNVKNDNNFSEVEKSTSQELSSLSEDVEDPTEITSSELEQDEFGQPIPKKPTKAKKIYIPDERIGKIISEWNKYNPNFLTGKKIQNKTCEKEFLTPVPLEKNFILEKRIKDRLRMFPEISQWERAIKKYAEDIINRPITDSYATHRFSLYEFVNQNNGFLRFVNK